MNTNENRIVTEFRPETRFELTLSPGAPFRAVEENDFERLKARLLAELLDENWDPSLNSLLRRAANEASAWARLTPYPALLFPVLLEEKAAEALRVAEHKTRADQRRREIVSV